MNTVNIFLDDERVPAQASNWMRYPSGIEWVVVRTVSEFRCVVTDVIETGGTLGRISFDHDLQDFVTDDDGIRREETGYTAIRWLINLLVEYAERGNPLVIPTVDVHTRNPVGMTNITDAWSWGTRYLNHLDKTE